MLPINLYPYVNLTDINLDYILTHFKEFIDSIVALNDWCNTHEQEYLELKKLYDDIIAGRFPPALYNTLHNWVVNNAASIMTEVVKMVFFGITDDGYFVAYIPDSWSDIIFGTTGLDVTVAGVEYGHLVLSY